MVGMQNPGQRMLVINITLEWLLSQEGMLKIRLKILGTGKARASAAIQNISVLHVNANPFDYDDLKNKIDVAR